MNKTIFLLLGFIVLLMNSFAQDPNFHIYLCFGQSNMEGSAMIEEQDKIADKRFQVLQAIDCPELGRENGRWYPAVPPLCQCGSGLSPADYFGRTMVANSPEKVTIGVVVVAIGGCDIRVFDKSAYPDYDSTYAESWFADKIKAYDWNPYFYLISLARQAQKSGIIKGVLLHQGETNTGDNQWPVYVKNIYTNILEDLSLSAQAVPLLAGELYSGEHNCCGRMNPIINQLPEHIPTAHIISSKGCTGFDEAHFDSEGVRELGKRYALKMLELSASEVK